MIAADGSDGVAAAGTTQQQTFTTTTTFHSSDIITRPYRNQEMSKSSQIISAAVSRKHNDVTAAAEPQPLQHPSSSTYSMSQQQQERREEELQQPTHDTNNTIDRNNSDAILPMELEHSVGFSTVLDGIHMLPFSQSSQQQEEGWGREGEQPNGSGSGGEYLHIVGGCLVLSHVSDPHSQVFLRGHSDDISCLAVAPRTGSFFVSGQKGRDADVCIWDRASLRVVHRFSAIERGVTHVAISADESLIAAVGKNRVIYFIDPSNGGLVARLSKIGSATGVAATGSSSSQNQSINTNNLFSAGGAGGGNGGGGGGSYSAPQTTSSSSTLSTDEIQSIALGCRVEDSKRKATNRYHFSVCTDRHVYLYYVDPYEGSVVANPHQPRLSTAFQRQYTCIQLSTCGDLLFIGSTAGDVAVVDTSSGAVVTTAQQLCTNGVQLLKVLSHRQQGVDETTDDDIINHPHDNSNSSSSNFRYARFGPGSQRRSDLLLAGGDGTLSWIAVEDHAEPSISTLQSRDLSQYLSASATYTTPAPSSTPTTVVASSFQQQNPNSESSTTKQSLAHTQRSRNLKHPINGLTYFLPSSSFFHQEPPLTQVTAVVLTATGSTRAVPFKLFSSSSQNNKTHRQRKQQEQQELDELQDQIVALADAVPAGFECISTHPQHPSSLITASRDGLLRRWDLNSYQLERTFTADAPRVSGGKKGTEWSGGSSGHCHGAAHHWASQKLGANAVNNVSSRGAQLHGSSVDCGGYAAPPPHITYATDTAVVSGLNIMLSTWTDGGVRCHGVQSGELLWCLPEAHRVATTAVCVGPSRTVFVTGSLNGEIKVWDLRSRALRAELQGAHQDRIIKVRFLRGESVLLTVSRDRSFATWDMGGAGGVPRRLAPAVEAHSGPLTAVCFPPAAESPECGGGSDHPQQQQPPSVYSETTLFTAGSDKVIAQWDLRQRGAVHKARYSHAGSDAYCTAMAHAPPPQMASASHASSYDDTTTIMSTSEHRLVTGGTDQVVTLWDTRGGAPANSPWIRPQRDGHRCHVHNGCTTGGLVC